MSSFDQTHEEAQPGGTAQEQAVAPVDDQQAARAQSSELGDVAGLADVLLTRLLRVGSQGEDVAWLQRGLNVLGEGLATDGLFGPLTQGGVMRFQERAGVTRDGLVGPVTWSALTTQATGTPPNPHQMDPRLERNDRQIATPDGRVITVDQDDTRNRDHSGLPWLANGEWDHAHILSQWSQIDQDTGTATDEVRCAANAALAPRIISGPDSVISYAEALMAKAETLAAASTTPQDYRDRVSLLRFPVAMAIAAIRSSQFYHRHVAPIGPIPPDPFGGIGALPHFADPATYNELSVIADATKRLVSVQETGLSNAQEAANMMALDAASQRSIGQQIDSRAEMQGFLDALLPGQAYTVLVDTGRGDPDPTHVHQAAESDHFITLGREPEPKGGFRYLYDPWPRTGSQIIYVDHEDREARFWPYFEVDPQATGHQDVFKRTFIVSVATAR